MTASMKRALEAILSFVSLHGATPSIQGLASQLGCARSNANRLLNCLHERGHITRGSQFLALGGGGVAVIVPADIAAKLATFCKGNGESISAVTADAIVLHLDSLGESVDA
jgi:hypothetical protein